MDLVSVLLVEDDRTIVENLTGFFKRRGIFGEKYREAGGSAAPLRGAEV